MPCYCSSFLQSWLSQIQLETHVHADAVIFCLLLAVFVAWPPVASYLRLLCVSRLLSPVYLFQSIFATLQLVLASPSPAGEPSVSTNKIKVVGARRIWGTLKSSSTKTVKSVILQVSKIEGELRIKRKDKENRTTGRPKWWYVVHGSESTLMELEAKWDQVKVQTSWKLEPCFLTESQNISPPSATTTDAASTLLPTHIQPSTDVQPLPSPPQHPVAADMQPLPSSSQSPVLIECTQSEELDIQGNGHAP